MREENDAAADEPSPEQLLSEMEARLREIEAAGGESAMVVKHHLERLKRMMAAGEAQGVQFMRAGNETSGLIGFSIPLQSENREDDQEKDAT